MSDFRKAFWKEMETVAVDPKVILLTGDLGFPFYKEFKEKFPKQFVNAGCAEQSMVGIAAGMARGGLKPYVYSGSVFLLMRAYEQIRDDVCYNNLNVKLIGTGAAGFLGFTHNYMGYENEFDLIKNLPNIRYRDGTRGYGEKDLPDDLCSDGPIFIRL